MSSGDLITLEFNGESKLITTYAHLLTYGYIRNHENENDINVAYPIYNICLLHYYIHFYFGNNHSSKAQLFGNNHETVTFIDEFDEDDPNQLFDTCWVYGKHWIHSISNKIIKYHIKINNNSGRSLSIGIISNDQQTETMQTNGISIQNDIYHYTFDDDGYKNRNDLDENFFSVDYNYNYGYWDGCLVILTLDLKVRSLSLDIEFTNDFQHLEHKFKHGQWNNIKIGNDIKYKLAISAGWKDHSVTILNYSQK
eukprot:437444_1